MSEQYGAQIEISTVLLSQMLNLPEGVRIDAVVQDSSDWMKRVFRIMVSTEDPKHNLFPIREGSVLPHIWPLYGICKFCTGKPFMVSFAGSEQWSCPTCPPKDE